LAATQRGGGEVWSLAGRGTRRGESDALGGGTRGGKEGRGKRGGVRGEGGG